jgi:phosphate-selective porin OprO/OprP
MYESMEWAAEFDFVNAVRDGTLNKAVPAPTDLWWTFTKLPGVGNLRIGNHKEPIGFEHLVSSRFLPFLERSFNQDTFYGGFNNGFTPGALVFNTAFNERMTWALGVYKPTNNVFAYSTNSGDWATTGRVTWLPYFENDGEELLHLGVSGRAASTFHETIRFRTRGPERSGIASVWPLPADTGTFHGNEMYWVNGELVGVRGPWTFQSEWLVSFVQGDVATAVGVPVGTVLYHGGYAQILYYLTGEHDHYNRKTGFFERVVPERNAHPTDTRCPSACYPWGWLSCGAWQVGVRYNFLDLNDEGINGGVLQDVTFGLNWFLNPNFKIQWNYSATHRATADKIGEGFIHGFGMRLAHDF